MKWRLSLLIVNYNYCFFFFGNIFLSRSKNFPVLPPATTKVTDTITNISPMMIRVVSISPNTITPKNTAVTGSSTPRIAVGVEPMHCMASVVHINDIIVGKIVRATTLNHRYHCSGEGV